jgi:hypothetical protein
MLSNSITTFNLYLLYVAVDDHNLISVPGRESGINRIGRLPPVPWTADLPTEKPLISRTEGICIMNILYYIFMLSNEWSNLCPLHIIRGILGITSCTDMAIDISIDCPPCWFVGTIQLWLQEQFVTPCALGALEWMPSRGIRIHLFTTQMYV